MKCFAFYITIILMIIASELELSNQFGCPFEYWNRVGSLTVMAAENTLAELDINAYKQNSVRANNIKKKVSGGVLKDQFWGAMKSAKLKCAVPPVSCFNDSSNYYIRTYDGSCNNLMTPGYGMAKSRYSRFLKPNYVNSIYTPSKSSAANSLPNPRILSLSLYGEDTLSDSNRTLMTMQFGQFVAHDISELYREGLPSDCCTNSTNKMCLPILLHPFGPITMTTGKTCLNFARSLSDKEVSCPPSGSPYAEKITTTTAFLDLSSIYGNSLEQNAKIRQYKGGLLKTSWFNNKPFLPIQSSECPANNAQCYTIPDNRNQFTPTVAVLQTVFVREHNRLANILANINPHHSDERIFQIARKINIAQFQKITYYDWLPVILSPMYSFTNRLIYPVLPYDYVTDYDDNLNPAPFAEYAAAAFRYLHQSIPGWFSMVSSGRNSNQTMRLSDYFDRQDSMQLLMDEDNFDSLIRGLTTQLEKLADSNVDREIKHHFDRKSFEEYGTDLKSIDIQRGRDFGLPSYNQFRVHCGLKRAYQWSDLLNEIPVEKIKVLKQFYDSPNDVELSVGGSYEKHAPDSILGTTFQCIIGKQFLKTRIADRFFYENEAADFGFTRDQLAEIRKINLSSILCANGNSLQCVQPNIFFFPNNRNNLIKCKVLPQLDLTLWKDNLLYQK